MTKRLLPLIVPLLLLASCADDGRPGDRIDLEPAATPDAPTDAGPDQPGTGDGEALVLDDVPEVTAKGRDGYVEALTINFEHDPDNIALFGDGAACIAEAWIDDLGIETFETAGVTPQMLAAQQSMDTFATLDIDLDRSRALMGHLPDCGIEIVRVVLDSPIYDTADPETDACLEAGLTEPMVLDSLALALVPDADPDEAATLQGPLLEVLTDCEASAAE